MSKKLIKHQILSCSCPYCEAFKKSLYPIDFYYYPLDETFNQENLDEKESDPNRKVTNSFVSVNLIPTLNTHVNEKMTATKLISHPIYEFRGVWVTTVRNNDFPSQLVYSDGTFDLDLFKREFLAIIKRCKVLNLNAIFFQVRPQGDAFYHSELNPWSEYLTGQQGVEPEWGDFDPLKWMISMTHGAGLEFHAWFNPYRLSSISKEGKSKEELIDRLSNHHFAKDHPEYVYFFDGQIFLDPGFPQVLNHVVQSVMEVVTKYEVDAVHFDDYFYPYAYQTIVDGEPIEISFDDLSPDSKTYETFHQVGQTIKQWRENNINLLIFSLSTAIRRYNEQNEKSVAFGISPFGIWASNEKYEEGSKTSPYQLSSLDEYVNSKLWVEKEWIDYLVPQNYWSFSDALSPFDEVAMWWNNILQSSRTQLYMGLGLYLYQEDSGNIAWQNPNEIIEQIKYCRLLSNVEGFAIFTYHNLIVHPESTDTSQLILNQTLALLNEGVLAEKSLIPPRTWLQPKPIKPISGLQVKRCETDNCLVFYDELDNDSQYYVIYRCNGRAQNFDFNEASHILDVIGRNNFERMQSYTDCQIDLRETYTYAVTALSQAQVQSLAVAYVFEA